MHIKHVPVSLLYLISVTIMVAVFGIHFFRLPPEIPFDYLAADPNDQVVDVLYIFLLPMISLFFLLVNTFIERKFFADDILMKELLYVTNCVIVIGFLGLFVKIILLVT